MAKRKSTRTRKQDLHPFDVYAQEDGALAVLPAGDVPEYDVDPIWSGDAADERDAVAKARSSSRKYRNATAANPDHEPNMPDDTRQLAEQETNRRLGIVTRPTRKRRGAKKRTVKKAVRRTATKKRVTKRAKRRTRRY